MPQANNNTEFKKKFDKLSVTGFIKDNRFGIKDEQGNVVDYSGFRGYTLNADGYKVLMNHAQIGATLVFRKSKARNKKNEEQWFLEILPPREQQNNFKTRESNNQDDI